MFSIISDYVVFSKVIFIFRLFGSNFLKFKKLCFVLKRFVFGHNPLPISKAAEEEQCTSVFVAQCETLHSLIAGIDDNSSSLFRTLHDYGLKSNVPTGCILLSKKTHCRSCMKSLSVETKPHVVVVYHLKFGSFLGSRLTKVCRKCKIYEHLGYWTMNGQKHFDCEAIDEDYLLITEETAFDMDVMKDMSSLLVVGAVPFSTYASSYNRRFGMSNVNNTQGDVQVKRIVKENINTVYENRRCLDRRRLEEGFLIFAALQVTKKHGFELPFFPFDKNELAQMVAEPFHDAFVRTWAGHSCSKAGCNNVIVLDGNMKNARQVCSCKKVTELQFEGMDGAISVGCMNTPLKSSRFCRVHVDTATSLRNDAHLINGTKSSNANDAEVDDLLILKVCNDKKTRSGNFYEILWSNGVKTWVKDSNLPTKVKEIVENGEQYEQTGITVNVMGQKRKNFSLSQGPSQKKITELSSSKVAFESYGFATEEKEDNYWEDSDGAGAKHLISCGTEKGKHKCKNAKTAGILVFERPCGVVIDVRELYGSESKSQVYGHLHTLLNKAHMQKTDVICYDDACHLKKFAQNPVRSNNTETAKTLAQMEVLCDKFHFKNHTDKWCKANCNPYNSETLKEVNTEVCEQLFSWLSSFAPITKHMNRWRFLFLMLYVLDSHNSHVTLRV